VQSDAYIEEKAREDLSMAQPGDRKVVILPQSDGQPQVAPDAILVAPPQPNPVLVPSQDPAIATPTKFDVNPGLPVWRQWLTLFFP